MNHHQSNQTSLVLLLIGLIFAAANMRSPLVMIGSVASILHDNLKMSASDIGYLGALPMPLFALGSLVSPWLAKRFGLEKMIICMTLLLTVAVAGRVWAGTFILFIGTLVLSFAIGMLNALSAPFIKKHAPNNIALATGVFSLSMSALAGFAAWVVVPMASDIGWQLAMSLWAVFGCIAFAIWLFIYLKSKSTSVQQTALTIPNHFKPWQNLAAWQMAVLIGLQSFLFYTVASFLPSIAGSFGLTIQKSTQAAFVFQIMAPPAIILLTYLIKRGISTRLVGTTGGIMNALGVAGLLWLPGYLMFWSALMGFGCAMIFTLSLMMFSLRTTNAENARDLSGMVQAVGYSIALFGPLSMGLLFEMTNAWQTPLVLLLLLMTINIPFGYLASNPKKLD